MLTWIHVSTVVDGERAEGMATKVGRFWLDVVQPPKRSTGERPFVASIGALQAQFGSDVSTMEQAQTCAVEWARAEFSRALSILGDA